MVKSRFSSLQPKNVGVSTKHKVALACTTRDLRGFLAER
jgi:hypothetical protein